MSTTLAARLAGIEPSATLHVAQRAATLRAAGRDVISFALGEPDFDPPEHVLEAARRATAHASHYTAVAGIAELRAAVAEDSARRRGVRHEPDEVLVTVGAKHALFNLALALYEPDDEVIIPSPYWVSYPEHARLLGARPVVVRTEGPRFRLTPEALAAAASPRTRAVVLCSPSNPTGAAYDAAELAALAEVLRRIDAWIVLDEIYGELVYDGRSHVSLLSVAPDLRERVVVVDGVSKTFAMTGWRIGWLIGPRSLVRACELVQGQSTSNPTAVAQHAALAALTGAREPLQRMRDEFRRRRDVLVAGLDSIDGIRCAVPEGAFYAFADVRGLLGRRWGQRELRDDTDVASFLLEDALCAAVPGTAFGEPGYIRFSYATAMPLLERGLQRIRDAVATLR
ncbi:MAG: pyridoxal phosphate-dependent aminotransferase [Myxococcota bacterium]|nr:pyridoxal phosphate-dependent aminotransferase [Myxococcota bacterium]MDW8361722.1 pyridoxal phosphate-dependent aminotransferase [Myxococcales bacterium]